MQKHSASVKSKALKSFEKIGRINSNYQITIPAEIRKFMNAEAGGYIKTIFISGKLVIEPVEIVSQSKSKKTVSKNHDEKEEKEWKRTMLQKFLEGYDEADSVYDNL